MAELSEQQREFCRMMARGMSGRQAYAEAYGCELKSAAAAASRLLKRDYIQAELNRLTAAARELSRARDAQAIGDKAERMEMLWRMARDSEEAGNVGDAVRCVAELNRMDGAYEPEQVQVQAVALSFESLMENLAGSKT
ncbi:MAG: terminase small subunit [Akkermansia sp.]|nr:terminase small subunit [Akkermansia sp.]